MNDLQEQEDDGSGGESYTSSSSSTDGFYNNDNYYYNNQTVVSSSSSSSSSLSTADRRLGLCLSSSSRTIRRSAVEAGRSDGREGNTDTNNDRKEEEADSSLLVKVYMEGIPICRKLDLTIQRGYHTLFSTLSYMFNTPIFCPDVNNKGIPGKNHVLTYEDKDGDWMLVGDVPWEMFLNTVKKLRIQRHVT